MPANRDVSFIIHDSTSNDVLFPKGFGRGYEPDSVPKPIGTPRPLFGDAPDQLKELDDSALLAMTREAWETKSTLWHIRQYAANGSQMPTLDQNGQGYCWAYSVTRCVMYQRALMNQPYKRLSAHAVGCMVKNFQDEGGWCGLSLNFIRERGVPSIEYWPEKSMSRSNDKPEVWENAKGNVITEGWFDENKQPYDMNMTMRQLRTCLALRIPCAADFGHWGHSVNLHTLKEIDGELWPMGDNSWTDGWGDNGCFVLQGRKAIPDGCVAIRGIRASLN